MRMLAGVDGTLMRVEQETQKLIRVLKGGGNVKRAHATEIVPGVRSIVTRTLLPIAVLFGTIDTAMTTTATKNLQDDGTRDGLVSTEKLTLMAGEGLVLAQESAAIPPELAVGEVLLPGTGTAARVFLLIGGGTGAAATALLLIGGDTGTAVGVLLEMGAGGAGNAVTARLGIVGDTGAAVGASNLASNHLLVSIL
jgi:hypothetical protein